MWAFAVFFALVYGVMHAFFFYRVRVLLPDAAWASPALIVFLCAMASGPFLCHLLPLFGRMRQAKISAWVGYLWLGFLFLSLCGGLCIRLYNALAAQAAWPPLEGKAPVWALLAVVSLAFAYGLAENRRLKIEHVRLETSKLPPGTKRLCIAQISDLHLGFMNHEALARQVAEAVQSIGPDLIVCTGDLLDSYAQEAAGLDRIMQKMHAPLGKFAVLGNHEAYINPQEALDFVEKCGFTVLRGQAMTIPGVINIAGMDDPAIGQYQLQGSIATTAARGQEPEVLSACRNGLFTLLLKHAPRSVRKSRGLFDLQLSGHCHGGQIFPFHLPCGLAFPLYSGYHRLQKGSRIYTSRGSGTWGPPVRILALREVTQIEIINLASQQERSFP